MMAFNYSISLCYFEANFEKKVSAAITKFLFYFSWTKISLAQRAHCSFKIIYFVLYGRKKKFSHTTCTVNGQFSCNVLINIYFLL
jgi:hypothetical protein